MLCLKRRVIVDVSRAIKWIVYNQQDGKNLFFNIGILVIRRLVSEHVPEQNPFFRLTRDTLY